MIEFLNYFGVTQADLTILVQLMVLGFYAIAIYFLIARRSKEVSCNYEKKAEVKNERKQ